MKVQNINANNYQKRTNYREKHSKVSFGLDFKLTGNLKKIILCNDRFAEFADSVFALRRSFLKETPKRKVFLDLNEGEVCILPHKKFRFKQSFEIKEDKFKFYALEIKNALTKFVLTEEFYHKENPKKEQRELRKIIKEVQRKYRHKKD